MNVVNDFIETLNNPEAFFEQTHNKYFNLLNTYQRAEHPSNQVRRKQVRMIPKKNKGMTKEKVESEKSTYCQLQHH